MNIVETRRSKSRATRYVYTASEHKPEDSLDVGEATTYLQAKRVAEGICDMIQPPDAISVNVIGDAMPIDDEHQAVVAPRLRERLGYGLIIDGTLHTARFDTSQSALEHARRIQAQRVQVVALANTIEVCNTPITDWWMTMYVEWSA